MSFLELFHQPETVGSDKPHADAITQFSDLCRQYAQASASLQEALAPYSSPEQLAEDLSNTEEQAAKLQVLGSDKYQESCRTQLEKEEEETAGHLKQIQIAQQKIIDNALKKKSKLLQLAADGKLEDNDFIFMSKQCNDEIKAAEAVIEELNEQLTSSEEFRHHMEEIRQTLKAAERDAADGLIGKDFVQRYIDKIFATPMGDDTMRLYIKIFTGENTEKYLKKLTFRAGQMIRESKKSAENVEIPTVLEDTVSTGNTFKKMIESYEKNL